MLRPQITLVPYFRGREDLGGQRLSRKTEVDIQTEVTDRSTKVYIHKECFNRNRRWMQGMMENIWNEKNTCAQDESPMRNKS